MLRVNNLLGFSGGVDVPIAWTDDGSASSTTAGSTHTFASQTSAGPVSFLMFMIEDSADAAFTVSGVTWGGVAVTERASVYANSGADYHGLWIGSIAGAQTGDVVLTTTTTTDLVRMTKVSALGLNSAVPTSTDSAANATSQALSLSSLTNPGAKGGVLACALLESDAASSFTNATEIDNASVTLGADTLRAVSATVTGIPAGTISANPVNIILGASFN